MTARQHARVADLSLLLDVVLRSNLPSVKREFVKCGALNQLQQVVGRNFSKDYSVVIRKVLRVVDFLPLTSDDLYLTRSAHGSFADMLRAMASTAADAEVRSRAHSLLKKFPASGCSEGVLAAVRSLQNGSSNGRRRGVGTGAGPTASSSSTHHAPPPQPPHIPMPPVLPRPSWLSAANAVGPGAGPGRTRMPGPGSKAGKLNALGLRTRGGRHKHRRLITLKRMALDASGGLTFSRGPGLGSGPGFGLGLRAAPRPLGLMARPLPGAPGSGPLPLLGSQIHSSPSRPPSGEPRTVEEGELPQVSHPGPGPPPPPPPPPGQPPHLSYLRAHQPPPLHPSHLRPPSWHEPLAKRRRFSPPLDLADRPLMGVRPPLGASGFGPPPMGAPPPYGMLRGGPPPRHLSPVSAHSRSHMGHLHPHPPPHQQLPLVSPPPPPTAPPPDSPPLPPMQPPSPPPPPSLPPAGAHGAPIDLQLLFAQGVYSYYGPNAPGRSKSRTDAEHLPDAYSPFVSSPARPSSPTTPAEGDGFQAGSQDAAMVDGDGVKDGANVENPAADTDEDGSGGTANDAGNNGSVAVGNRGDGGSHGDDIAGGEEGNGDVGDTTDALADTAVPDSAKATEACIDADATSGNAKTSPPPPPPPPPPPASPCLRSSPTQAATEPDAHGPPPAPDSGAAAGAACDDLPARANDGTFAASTSKAEPAGPALVSPKLPSPHLPDRPLLLRRQSSSSFIGPGSGGTGTGLGPGATASLADRLKYANSLPPYPHSLSAPGPPFPPTNRPRNGHGPAPGPSPEAKAGLGPGPGRIHAGLGLGRAGVPPPGSGQGPVSRMPGLGPHMMHGPGPGQGLGPGSGPGRSLGPPRLGMGLGPPSGRGIDPVLDRRELGPGGPYGWGHRPMDPTWPSSRATAPGPPLQQPHPLLARAHPHPNPQGHPGPPGAPPPGGPQHYPPHPHAREMGRVGNVEGAPGSSTGRGPGALHGAAPHFASGGSLPPPPRSLPFDPLPLRLERTPLPHGARGSLLGPMPGWGNMHGPPSGGAITDVAALGPHSGRSPPLRNLSPGADRRASLGTSPRSGGLGPGLASGPAPSHPPQALHRHLPPPPGGAGAAAAPPTVAAALGADGPDSPQPSWQTPDERFVAFVHDTVRHRLGKYVQPDHPSRVTHEDVELLYRKISREIIHKEQRAFQERQVSGVMRPIERMKLEANIKDFVRLSIRKLHMNRSG